MEITCSHCQTTTSIDIGFEVEYFACPNCHSYFEADSIGILKKKGEFTQGPSYKSIPLGEKGMLDGIEYTITGVLLKKSPGSSPWFEYILEPKKGDFLFLSEYDGHWTIFREIDTRFSLGSQKKVLLYNKSTFNLYETSKVSTLSAKGFFDFAINPGVITVSEYVHVPYMISIEKQNKEEYVFHGEHIAKRKVKAAFPQYKFPSKKGVGIVQPFMINMSKLSLMLTLTVVLILFTQIFLVATRSEKKVLDTNLSFADYNNKEFVSPSFSLDGRTSPLRITANTDVDNSWVNIDISLINEKTNEAIFAGRDIEYYHGYSDGESWAEGDRTANIDICGIKPGQYHLVIYPQKAPEDLVNNRISITAVWNGVSFWNFWMVFILIVTSLVTIYFISLNFETRRWSDSSYSPYKQS